MRRDNWLLSQLPMGVLDDEFFVRFVSIFQEVATSYLEDADNIDHVLDVSVAPPEHVRWLGSWIGMPTFDPSLDEGFQRALVTRSSQILAWRGTRRGLEQFLEVVTGGPAQVEESGSIRREREGVDDAPLPSVRIRVESIGTLTDDDFVELVSDEIPASAVYELFVGDRQLWPAPAPVAVP